MNANAPSTRLLLSLLALGQQDETIDLFSVAEEAGLSLYGALKGLAALSEQGLVDAGRMRLTLAGLTVTCGIEGAARAAGLGAALADGATAEITSTGRAGRAVAAGRASSGGGHGAQHSSGSSLHIPGDRAA